MVQLYQMQVKKMKIGVELRFLFFLVSKRNSKIFFLAFDDVYLVFVLKKMSCLLMKSKSNLPLKAPCQPLTASVASIKVSGRKC